MKSARFEMTPSWRGACPTENSGAKPSEVWRRCSMFAPCQALPLAEQASQGSSQSLCCRWPRAYTNLYHISRCPTDSLLHDSSCCHLCRFKCRGCHLCQNKCPAVPLGGPKTSFVFVFRVFGGYLCCFGEGKCRPSPDPQQLQRALLQRLRTTDQ